MTKYSPSPEVRASISAKLKGRHLSDETKHKMSETRKIIYATPEMKERFSLIHKGRKRSPETCNKLQISTKKAWTEERRKQFKEYCNTPEHKQQVSSFHTGRERSENTKQKMRIAREKYIISDDTKHKISRTLLGTHLSDSTKIKIGKANKGRIKSKDERLKISENGKKRYKENPSYYAKLAESNRTRPISEEFRHQASERAKKLWQDETFRNKIHLVRSKGEQCHFWKGGKSFEAYTPIWGERIREAIRERDECTCYLCKKHQSQLVKRLSVHHIDYNKHNCNPFNLITLCNSCHAKTGEYRAYWQDYFTNLMMFRFQEDRII